MSRWTWNCLKYSGNWRKWQRWGQWWEMRLQNTVGTELVPIHCVCSQDSTWNLFLRLFILVRQRNCCVSNISAVWSWFLHWLNEFNTWRFRHLLLLLLLLWHFFTCLFVMIQWVGLFHRLAFSVKYNLIWYFNSVPWLWNLTCVFFGRFEKKRQKQLRKVSSISICFISSCLTSDCSDLRPRSFRGFGGNAPSQTDLNRVTRQRSNTTTKGQLQRNVLV